MSVDDLSIYCRFDENIRSIQLGTARDEYSSKYYWTSVNLVAKHFVDAYLNQTTFGKLLAKLNVAEVLWASTRDCYRALYRLIDHVSRWPPRRRTPVNRACSYCSEMKKQHLASQVTWGRHLIQKNWFEFFIWLIYNWQPMNCISSRACVMLSLTDNEMILDCSWLHLGCLENPIFHCSFGYATKENTCSLTVSNVVSNIRAFFALTCRSR